MTSSSKQVWQLGEAGILRKKEEEDELLVFGYSCKLFRDDEKALYIDQGKHLIPWMADDSLKIDRYDGRGALYDLKQYEAPPGGYDENLLVSLSDSERHVEMLCNEERFRSLHRNDEEEAIYQEEELKRLHQALDGKSYGEVAFDYDGAGSAPPKGGVAASPGGSGEPPAAAEEEDGDEPFVPPPELDIPVNMVLPEMVKLNAIIEKTALFISSQGAQMEILLKMKQAGNPQFDFLSYDSPLHRYYRHLQMAIKTGRYRPKPDKDNPADDAEEDGDDDDYLHPSLASSSARVELAPSIPSIAYKPSANCAYSMLVNRIKDKQAAFSIQPPGTADAVLPGPVPAVQAPPVHKPTPPVIEATPVLYKTSSSPKSEAESAVTVCAAAPAGQKVFTPVTQTSRVANVVSGPSHTATYTLLPPAVATSTSFLAPPQDVQLIIDKMASYVAKNGRDFESIVRAKGDPRFEFLKVNHQYYPYYLHKVDVYEQIHKPRPVVPVPAHPVTPVEPVRADSEESSGSDPDSGEEGGDTDPASNPAKPALAPVCFSIKKPRESDAVLDTRSALPLEESSDEGGEETAATKKETALTKKELAVAKREAAVAKREADVLRKEAAVTTKKETAVTTKKEAAVTTKKEAAVTTKKEAAVTTKKETAVTECIDLTLDLATSLSDDVDEKRTGEKDRWEEKVRDKLAAAARERLATTAREKQLQSERKRRAAAFLTMINRTPGSGDPPPPKLPRSGDGTPRGSGEDDDVSVTSIPSPASSTSASADGGGAEERLKANGGPTSLLARIQGGKEMERRTNKASSDSDERPDAKKPKKAKRSHKRERMSSPAHRSHKHRRDTDHTKTNKSKKRARSKSPKPRRVHSHRQSHRDPATRPSESRSKKKSERKSKRERRSSVSDYSS